MGDGRMSAKKRVLVTGSSGFIGRRALQALCDRGFEVHALTTDRNRTAMLAELSEQSRKDVTFHQCDLFNRDALLDSVREVSASHLLHFAWDTTHGKFWTTPNNLTWVAASANLFRSFAESGGKRIVAAGTCAEYLWTDETLSERHSPCRPSTLYGTCKNSLQEILLKYASDASLTAAWGRIFFLYGPNEGRDRFVSSAILHLLAGKPFEMTHGRQVRDFLHVDDVALAFVTLLDSELHGIVNVGSGEARELREIVSAIGRILNRSELIRLDAKPAPPTEPGRIVPDIGILRDELGFRPRFSLEAGLSHTVEWWRRRERRQEL